MEQNQDKLKEIISHSKEYGFIFPSSEIYDGLAATYDYGQLGVELKNNIKAYSIVGDIIIDLLNVFNISKIDSIIHKQCYDRT